MKLQHFVFAFVLGLSACGGNSGGGGGGGGGGDADTTDNDPTDNDPASCTLGERRCAAGSAQDVEECQADGSWSVATTCQAGTTCANAQCATSGSCTPGARRCGGSTGQAVEVCQMNGTWQSYGVCNTGCSNGVCPAAACTPGSSTCGELYQDNYIAAATQTVLQECYGDFQCEQVAPGPHGPRVGIVIAACSPEGQWFIDRACPDCLTTAPQQVAHCEACGGDIGPTCAVMDGCALNCGE